ncbi:MAG: DUF523 domain-containing protein [Desulfomonilia bacterium]
MPRESYSGHLEGPVLVSSCLLGIPCRYNGQHKVCPDILQTPGIIPIPVCPEQMGGLSTPRNPAHFIGGDGRSVLSGNASVVDTSGVDVTRYFIAGARATVMIATLLDVKWAILKEDSPSCGTHLVYISGSLVRGVGVAAALLYDMGVCLMNENKEIL